MKVVGIIAEYNPFHNGHKYQIDALKEKTGADYCIIAMSGNFLQRGLPALCDKYTRTRMALSCGADLVLELPCTWATASAEYFAHGGVALLKNTGIVTHLGFGAEAENLESLLVISSILRDEPNEYKTALSEELKAGNAFPTARKNALSLVFSRMDTNHLTEEKLYSLLDMPNNILALEYLKALPDSITPVMIQRKGAGYHDTKIAGEFSSATAIRSSIFTTMNDTLDTNTSILSRQLEANVPAPVISILQDCLNKKAFMDTNDLSDIVGYRLLSLASDGYQDYADSNNELSNKILKNLNQYIDFEDFCQSLKTKNLTYTRISRLLLHILLNIKQEDYLKGKALGYSPYLRILGFRKDATELLSAIKEEATVPLISKVADAASYLSPEAYALFEKDLYASAIYNQVMTIKKGQPPANDFTTPIAIV